MKRIVDYISIVEDILIVFLYFFGLIIPIFRTSSLLLLFILPIRLLFEPESVSIVKNIIASKYIVKIIASYLILILYAYSNVTIHMTFDYSLMPTLINVILHLIVGIFIVSLFLKKNRDITYVQNTIISVFVIQSLIQISAFLSPSVHSFVQLFQSESTIARADLFSGRKGVALAGTVFFGLSTIYGMSFFFLVKRCVDKCCFKFFDIILGIILIIGSFFTGRTFFVGLGLSGLYFIASSISFSKKISTIIKIILICIFSVLILINIIPKDLYDKIYNLILYVFEAIFNFESTGSFSTTSTNKLFGDMYFQIPLSTFFLGDGLYEGLNGGYYMNTDAGYMRIILYTGISGLILSLIPDLLLIWGNTKLKGKTISLFNTFLFIYMCALNLKGEVFGYLITFHCVMFLYYIFISFSPSHYNTASYDSRYSHMHIK